MSDTFDVTADLVETEERISKSQLKRKSAALQDLAEELAKLPRAQLAALPLPEEVYAALCSAAAMPPRGARKRQLKYIGGLFRDIDVQAIVEKLALIKNQSAAAARQLYKVERWRERLVAGDGAELSELLSNYPGADRQRLRQLIRSAKNEVGQNAASKSARLLFRYLRDLFETDDKA